MIYQRLIVSVFVVLVLPLTIFAQRPEAKPQTDTAVDLWRIRAQTITDDVLKDASNLNSLRRAVVWARLAELWWPDDPQRARTWISNGIEVVEQVPNKEKSDERSDRLKTARFLLNITASLDQKLAKRLLAILGNEESVPAERIENADALITTAIHLAQDDPKRAAEIGAIALRLGPPHDIAGLLFALRPRDAKLADALFVQTLALARQNLSPQLLMSLTYAAFPAQRGQRADTPVPPEPLRTELLQVDVAFLNANPINPKNREAMCASIASYVAPIVSEFERLLPNQLVVVRQAIEKCQSLAPLLQQHLDLNLGSESLNSVGGLLDAAADAKDEQVRTVYLYRAAALAKQNKNYEQAVKILDSMGKEAHEMMGDAWSFYRWDWAAEGALDHYKHGRLLEMNALLNAVPSDLQPIAKTAFVDRLQGQKGSETELAIQFINDVRTGLRRSNTSESDKAGCYFVLLRLILKYDPSQTSAVLKDGVAALNRADQAKQDKELKTLDRGMFSKMLPASLLEVDEFGVREGIAAVTATETRTQLRLVLLEATLQRVRETKPKTSTP